MKNSKNIILFCVMSFFSSFTDAQNYTADQVKQQISDFIYAIQNRDFNDVVKIFNDIDYSYVKSLYTKQEVDSFEFSMLKICVFSIFDESADFAEENAVLIFKFLLDQGFNADFIGEQVLYVEVGSCFSLDTGNILHFALTQYVEVVMFSIEISKIMHPEAFQDQETLTYVAHIESLLLSMIQELLHRGINVSSQGLMYDFVCEQEKNVTVLEYLDFVRTVIQSGQNKDAFWESLGLNLRQFVDCKKALLAKLNAIQEVLKKN
jgi:hypothetical protein